MIKSVNKHICALPCIHAGITKEFSSSHNGTDWGAKVGYKYYEDVYATQDGIVREVGYSANDIGYYVTIESQYDDGTHSFWGYIHLQSSSKLKKGEKVEAGKTIIGVRGGSPYVSGKEKYTPHLHLYSTKPTTIGYSWNNMRSLVVNPFSIYTFCKMKDVKYDMAIKDGHNFNNAPIYEDMLQNDEEEIKRLREELASANDKLNEANRKLEQIKNIL